MYRCQRTQSCTKVDLVKWPDWHGITLKYLDLDKELCWDERFNKNILNPIYMILSAETNILYAVY